MDILAYTDKDKCSGCKACYNTCPSGSIEFIKDEFGFEYPYINESLCVKCGKCVSVCNFTQNSIGVLPANTFAATNRDKTLLNRCSSGGVFSVVAEYVLENNGVVCGCIFDQKLNPIHICTQKKDDYLKMLRSKYVQSDVGHVYNEIKKYLKEEKTVLFSGTPCQVDALYAVLGKQYDNLITIDLVCHGVPSNAMFQSFLDYLEDKYRTEITDFNFRSKKYGWQRFTMEFKDKNGRTKNIGKANEFYFPAFSMGNIMRPSCFSCKYASPERVGDLTIGDFWGHEKLKLNCDTVNGTSLLTFNTQKAKDLLPVLSQKLILDEIDYTVAVAGNTCLRQPTRKGNKWNYYMEAMKTGSIALAAKKYTKNNKKAVLRGKIKLLIPLSLFKAINKRRTVKK